MLAARFQPYLFAGLAMATLAAFVAYDLWREHQRSIADVKATTTNVARLLDQQTAQLLGRVDAVLSDFESRLALGGKQASRIAASPQEVGAAVPSLWPSDGLIRALYVLDTEGRPLQSVAGSGPPPALDAAFLADWRARAPSASGNRLTIGRPWAESNGQWVFPVSRLKLDARTPVERHHLVGLVSLAAVQPLLDSVDSGRNGFVTLFLRDGWMLATSPRSDALLGRSWLQTPMFQEHLASAPAGTVRQVVVRDRTERIYSYRELAQGALVVSTGISMTDALADWRARIVADSLLLSIVAAAGLWGAAQLSRNYARRESAERAADEATQRIEQSERFVREVTDNVPMRIAYLDRELRYRFANRAQCEPFERPRDDVLGRTREELTGLPLPVELQRRANAVLQGATQHFEFEELRDGTPQVIEAHFVPALGPGGQVQGFYTASTDVTERHLQQRRIEQALAERETLLREVYHRVKNNLQVVQSLLNLQRRSLPEGPALAALDDSVKRVHAMALVHEKLYQTSSLDAVSLPDYVPELLRYLADTGDAARRGIVLQPDIDQVQASLEVSVPLGLLITELVGNSLKHGFPDGRAGSIQVRLFCDAETTTLEVEDDGVGLPPGFDLTRVTSMGLQLAGSLAGQLGGQLRAAGANGAKFTARLVRLL